MPPDRQRSDQGQRNSAWQRAKRRLSLAVALSTIQPSGYGPRVSRAHVLEYPRFAVYMGQCTLNLLRLNVHPFVSYGKNSKTNYQTLASSLLLPVIQSDSIITTANQEAPSLQPLTSGNI
ncbi:hypothetical protein TNCV_4636891 [Trichonephila clavipes]|nr:hypothetical protein TNCV_4636891 [Trichonephila clavipes]